MPRPGKPSAALPSLYAGWMDALLEGPIPAETNATCHDCAMSPPAEEAPGSTFLFKPASKCCTYWPALPNFLVGRILADEDPALEGVRDPQSIRAVTRHDDRFDAAVVQEDRVVGIQAVQAVEEREP